jgi:[protein-PII] uridylyltransferase
VVGTLVSRLDSAFADEIDGAGMLASAEDVRRDAIALVGEDLTTTRVLTTAPVRYLASRTPSEAASDARLLAGLGAPGSRGQFASRVSPGSVPRTHRLAIATIDRPGVFALVAGVVALSGLDVLGASADAGPSGTALDTFTVRPATLAAPDDNTWATLERYLAAALEGHFDLRTRLVERQRQYGARSAGRPRVTIGAPRAFATAVRVSAGDRPGLLFDIADEIAAAGYVVTRANALTRGARAHDTFHLVDADGMAPTDPGALGHLAMRLRERLR